MRLPNDPIPTTPAGETNPLEEVVNALIDDLADVKARLSNAENFIEREFADMKSGITTAAQTAGRDITSEFDALKSHVVGLFGHLGLAAPKLD